MVIVGFIVLTSVPVNISKDAINQLCRAMGQASHYKIDTGYHLTTVDPLSSKIGGDISWYSMVKFRTVLVVHSIALAWKCVQYCRCCKLSRWVCLIVELCKVENCWASQSIWGWIDGASTVYGTKTSCTEWRHLHNTKAERRAGTNWFSYTGLQGRPVQNQPWFSPVDVNRCGFADWLRHRHSVFPTAVTVAGKRG